MFDPKVCVRCHAALSGDANFCTKCGAPAPKCEENHCENSACSRCTSGHCFGPEDLYCDKCGKPTTLGKKISELI